MVPKDGQRSNFLLLLYFILFLPLLIGISSCDELTGSYTGADQGPQSTELKLIGGIPFIPLGNQRFLLRGTMPNGGKSSKNFRVNVNIPTDRQIKFFFFSHRDLTEGLTLLLRNAADEIFISFSLNGFDHEVSLGRRSSVLDLSLDVHNNHSDVHIVMWEEGGPYGDEEGCVDDGSCLYNTESFTFPNPGPWGSQGRGGGVYWGFAGDSELILRLSGPREPLSNV